MGGRPNRGRPSTECTVTRGPDQLEQPRHEIDLYGEGSQLAQQHEQLVHRLVGERDDHALDVEALDDLGEALRAAEDGQVLGQVAAPGLRLPVDESDDVEPVLRVLDQLAGDQLTDLAGAQDQRVLDVGAGSLAQAAGDGPHHRQEGTIAIAQNVISA